MSWWWTGRPGMLQSMGSQRVGHDKTTEMNWTELTDFLTLQIKYYWESLDRRQLNIDMEGFSLRHIWILRHPYGTLGLCRASGRIRDPLMILNTRCMIGHSIRLIPLSSFEEWWGGGIKWKPGRMTTKGMEIDEERMVNDTLTRAERMVSDLKESRL